MEKNDWQTAIDVLDYAFQPIVNCESKLCYGYEALLRNYEQAGFDSIQAFMNASYGADQLQWVNSLLIEKAIIKFLDLMNLKQDNRIKLFFNLDSRLLSDMSSLVKTLQTLYQKYNLTPPMVCFEVTEFFDVFGKKIDEYSMENRELFEIAIDDFGTGFSDLKLLYYLKPEFIKIDRFFVSDIEKNFNKRIFLIKIIKMAEVLGTKVVAEGVESEMEFIICKHIGCKLAQGFFIRKPDVEISRLVDF